MTPLTIAVEKENKEIVQLLLSNKDIDVNIKYILNNHILILFQSIFYMKLKKKFYSISIKQYSSHLKKTIFFIQFQIKHLYSIPSSIFFLNKISN